ncbi:MAG: hypothetical protein RBG13Loki_3439 [Promethearchaeota archaeon CR_4]|nr:MAG: hypothetical protein RBG13Loki_3439 [Candidatus Lokiarchaeota archaeon CR_4]
MELRFTPTYVGTMKWKAKIKQPGRFTPTYVGTMTGNRPAANARSVHPHIRGDNTGKFFQNGEIVKFWGDAIREVS